MRDLATVVEQAEAENERLRAKLAEAERERDEAGGRGVVCHCPE